MYKIDIVFGYDVLQAANIAQDCKRVLRRHWHFQVRGAGGAQFVFEPTAFGSDKRNMPGPNESRRDIDGCALGASRIDARNNLKNGHP